MNNKINLKNLDSLVVGGLYTIYNPKDSVWNSYSTNGKEVRVCLFLGIKNVRSKFLSKILKDAYVFFNIEGNQEVFLEYQDFVNGFYAVRI